jgi:hypothetical protein
VAKGYTFIVARAYKSFGAFDSNAIATLVNAQKAGMTDVGVYLFPCTSSTRSAESQVSEMIEGLKNTNYNKVWIDVEANQSPNCGWTKDYDFNCNFLKSVVAAVKSHGK